ncbi:MAG: flavin reductase, partial [Planctomycetaceae bacterium]|nr:flavin reductase [Planctomycetaceae bacterium]
KATPEISPLAAAVGRIPSGVFILVAGNGAGATTGLLASWIQQASFSPPQVTVAVNQSRYLNEWLTDGSSVTLNQVAKGDNSLFRHFGKGFEPDADAFAGVEHVPASNGLPTLPIALSVLQGTVSGRMDAGDHVIYLIDVTDGMIQATDGSEPYVHLRKNGLSY